jgi:CRISPR-associated endonuclease Csn1
MQNSSKSNIEMKKILGLDLGTNSIGWAVVMQQNNEENKPFLTGVEASGSRIIPMDAAILGEFDRGNSISQTAERTKFRGVRRLLEKSLLRRERLNRVLDILGFLPSHYAEKLNRYGQIMKGEEPKLAWVKDEFGQSRFVFMESFNEMLEEFKNIHPELTGKKIPYDWTIYYLRKKALTRKISKYELAWLLHNFNQKRGYYQLREEEEDKPKNKKVEYLALQVVSVEDTGQKRGKDTWYNVHLDNGWVYRRSSSIPLDWVGKTKEFIVTTDINDDGTPKLDKDGEVKRSFRAPKEDDWTLIKEKTQTVIIQSGKTVGEYIYDTILAVPNQKIRGKLVQTIERKFYKEELLRILNKQVEFHAELKNADLYKACIEALYVSNDAYRQSISNRDFTYLFVDNIIFYQRPLKTKKHLIANCPFEEHTGVDLSTGEMRNYALKCIAKSHPLYQEFRLWQFIENLRIYKKGTPNDEDVTSEFLRTEEDYANLFEWLCTKKTINQKLLMAYPAFSLKKNATNYRWNYVEDKDYPANETRAQLLAYLAKANVSHEFLTQEIEEQLWHKLYSIDDKHELSKALTKFAHKHQLENTFVDVFHKFPPFKKEYGSYSAKAIKKLLSIMRMGRYWKASDIDANTLERIDKIITGEFDEKLSDRVREKAKNLTDLSHFKGLPVWLACYVVYNRHSEAKDVTKWETPADIRHYLASFKQHSMRNPIVEQVVTETLRTVHDIWQQCGHIDEIHIELGREMKNPADKRRQMTQQIADNENTNLRIKALLAEFADPDFGIENVRPHSPSQQEILRIYEDGVLSSVEIPQDIDDVIKKFKESDINKRPKKNEVLRYKLWLEQKYRSPYTGQPISLGKLFTSAYEIEHVIPQSRYFDDSFSNKVICESEINKLKGNYLGYEFIKKHSGQKVELAFGKVVTLFTPEEYELFVKEHYKGNRAKMRKLMMEDIPEEFIARQLNDSRYISKFIKGLLSNIVREEGEVEAMSKNVIVCTGGVTDRLKKDWGINDVWNKIILPRFTRLNEITESTQFTSHTANGHLVPSMPLELQKGFSKKRIDHRHHAMDAIVIACADRNIVNYLNNESASAKSKISRHDLKNLLCYKAKTDDKGNYQLLIRKPWETFTQDVYQTLESIIVSFKQNLRVINKASNCNTRFCEGRKKLEPQVGMNWAIRKPMHKDTVFGEVNLRRIKTVSLNEAIKNTSRIVNKDFRKELCNQLAQGKNAKQIKAYFEENKDVWQDVTLSKIPVYYFTKETNDRFFATRKPLDTSFDRKTIIESVTDTGIQKILLRHLEQNDNNPDLAFSVDGIDEMNRNIVSLNGGKFHQPILKVRKYEKADKFAIGVIGNKSSKFVEGAKGTNLYFAVYETEQLNEDTGNISRKRTYATIPLSVVIDRQKHGLSPAPADKNGNEPIFVLSPNELVYVPEKEWKVGDDLNADRIYKMVSAGGIKCFFVKDEVAKPIIDKYEFSSQNKMERALTGEMIKDVCIPIKIDRLGRIIKIGYE